MSRINSDLPEVDNAMCCMGAAVYGAGGCTCWRPVHDKRQERVREGPPAVREKMCADCAFRPGSPERRGDENYQNAAEGELGELVSDEQKTFFCHQGMRRRVAYKHPSGPRIEEKCAGSYNPPMVGGVSGRAWRADGNPADICAGFAASRDRRSRAKASTRRKQASALADFVRNHSAIATLNASASSSFVMLDVRGGARVG